MKLKKNRFRIKILKILLLVSIVPLFVISASNIFVILTTREQNIVELQNLALNNGIEKIRKFVNDKVENLNLVLAKDPQTVVPTNLFELSANQQNFFIDSLMEKAGNINEIFFIDKSGLEVAKRPHSTSTDPLDGVEVKNYTDENFFKDTVSGKKYIGKAEILPSGTSIQIAAQIENQDRQMIGIIMAEVDLSPVQDIIDNITLGNEGYIFLADGDNSVIYAPSAMELTEKDQDIKKMALHSLSNNSAYKTFKNDRGEDMVFEYKDLGLAGWKIYSEWAKKDAFKVVDSVLWQSYIILFFTLAFVLVISIFSAKQIVKPIEILNKGAKEIENGNLDHRLSLNTNDEFETLGEEFNKMIEILKENKELKDEFVFIAAHELRTPVTAIKGYVSMLIEGTFGKLEQPVIDNLNIVFGANERLVQLVNDLLEIARSESGKMVIEVKPVELTESVSTVLGELKSLADPKGIKLIYNRSNEQLNILADQAKLKEVLVNLIGNAIKYTTSGGDVEITHGIVGKEVVTHIKDHGLGIDPESLKKLFSKFYRVKTKHTAKIEGTGLGLFICKEIIERMGGRIWAESEEGKGSIFSFSLKIS
jgi:signal transduction histidine kinase